MGAACSFQDKTKEKPGNSKTSVGQDGKKIAPKPPVLTSKGSTLSSLAGDLEPRTETHRKWVAPLPTPLPKGPLLITPDVSSFTVTNSTDTDQHIDVDLTCLQPMRRDPNAERGGTNRLMTGANGERGGAIDEKGVASGDSAGTSGDRGGAGFLGVSTIQSGHSSVASDALSAAGYSTHSSNSMSLSSSLSTNTALTPSGLHKWKLPPRLEPLPDSLRKLLLGHPDSLLDLVTRPDVINLKVIAPEEDFMKERLLLWSDVIAPLRLVCAERGFSLSVQDDLWARNSLSGRALTLLAQHEAEIKVTGEVLSGHIANTTDVIVLLLSPSFIPRLPPNLSHEDYTLALVSLPDSSSTALLRSLYINNANLDPPRYELKVTEVTQHEGVKVEQLVHFMMESFLAQGGEPVDTLRQFCSDYRREVEDTMQNHQLLANSTVVLTPAKSTENATSGESGSNNTSSLAPNHNTDVTSLSSRPHSPFVTSEDTTSGQNQGSAADGCGTTPSSTKPLEASTPQPPPPTTRNGEITPETTSKARRKSSSTQIKTFCDVGEVLSCISNHCPDSRIIEILPRVGLSPEVTNGQQVSRHTPTSGIWSRVKDALTRLMETNMEQRQDARRQSATGVPRSLLEELVCQTHYNHRLAQPPPSMSPSPAPPSPCKTLLESVTLNSVKSILTSDNEQPVLVYAPPGWGLSTLAAQLINFNTVSFPTSLILYRFLGISPDSQTLMSTLLSITQQLDIILGQQKAPGGILDKNKTEPLSAEPLLYNICKRSTYHLPFFIILEGISLHNRKFSELEVMTLTSLLPRTTKLVILSSDTEIIRGLRAKIKDVHYVKATPWRKEDMMEMFHKSLQDERRYLTATQTSVVSSAIRSCPLPLYAAVVSHIASDWRSLDHVSEDDLPASLEEILIKVLEPSKSIVPCDCFSAMMAYLTCAVGGITPWEMGDLLSVNDTVLLSIYSDIRDPPIHRAPPIYWQVARAALRSFLHVFVSTSFYTETWASSSMRRCALTRFLGTRTSSTSLHREITDQFLGRWAGKKKPFPDPEEEIELLQDRFIMPQPDAYGKFLNKRRYMCLPTHLMLSGNKNSYAIDTCILNLPWIEQKINANSVLQILCDLEKAVAMDTSQSEEIKLLQRTIFNYSYVLNVNNREIYKCLQMSLKPPSKGSSSSSSKGSKSKQRKVCLKHFYTTLYSPPASFLYPLDEIKGTGAEKLYSSAIPLPAVDDVIPVTGAHNENFMATLLRSEGEIKVIDIVNNKTVRTLTGADRPQKLLMLDSSRAVVLCNRELYILDLDSGHVVTKLRCVLNLRLPLFALQDCQHVVALSRDRMVAQVLDINTGAIVTSFKAGETRFLDSLLVSGDGRVLVCGDETQKPSPLLVWSLERCKLLHDIRLPQHEFLSNMAAISHTGSYLACACREVEDHSSNCVAIFDLVSGQVVTKIRLTTLCTSVAMLTDGDTVLVVLDSGQLLVWDLVAGNRRFLIDGVQASMTGIVATPDGSRCLTYSTENFAISSHTVVLWDLVKGELMASHTFPAGVTCAHLTPDGKMAAVGVKGEYQPTRLLLVPEGTTLAQTAQTWRQEMLAGSDVSKTFGDPLRRDAIINLVTD